MEQTVSNVRIDMFPRFSHASGANPGGAKIVILRLILLDEKNHYDASFVLFLMITSLPSQCIILQGGAGPALQ